MKEKFPKLEYIQSKNILLNLEEEKDTDIEIIKELQTLLNEKGFYCGTVDGIVGKKTLYAFAKAKKHFYLNKPTIIGITIIDKLFEIDPITGLYMPTNGIGWISSQFGHRSMGFHKGIDIACPEGIPVYAIEEGKVIVAITGCEIGSFNCGGGYGNCVYLQHKNFDHFDESRYAHLSKVSVYTNQTVRRGQKIGEVGNTGHSFGNHLHFELRSLGKAFNPITVLPCII